MAKDFKLSTIINCFCKRWLIVNGRWLIVNGFVWDEWSWWKRIFDDRSANCNPATVGLCERSNLKPATVDSQSVMQPYAISHRLWKFHTKFLISLICKCDQPPFVKPRHCLLPNVAIWAALWRERERERERVGLCIWWHFDKREGQIYVYGGILTREKARGPDLCCVFCDWELLQVNYIYFLLSSSTWSMICHFYKPQLKNFPFLPFVV